MSPDEDRQYFIRKRVLGSKPRVAITRERFLELVDAREGISETLGIEEKYDLLLENYLAFSNGLLSLSTSLAVRPWTSWSESRGHVGVVHRHLLNLLSAGRLYLDQVRHHLSTMFGKESDEYEAFVDYTRSAYDERFGYRVLETLRNFVQHRGVPVGAAHDHWRSELANGTVEKRTTVRVYILLDALASDRKFKKAVLWELQEIDGRKVELGPLVQEWMQTMGDLHAQTREAVADFLPRWRSQIQDAVDEYKEYHGEDVVGLSALETGSRGFHRHVWLGLAPSEWLEALRKRNTTGFFGSFTITNR